MDSIERSKLMPSGSCMKLVSEDFIKNCGACVHRVVIKNVTVIKKRKDVYEHRKL